MKAFVSACAAVALVAGMSAASGNLSTASAQTSEASEKFDLNGVWKVSSDAYFDLEAHAAKPAMQTIEGPYGPVPDRRVLALGALGAVPANQSVVSTGTIPYTEEALAQRDENAKNWITSDPNIKCYQPGVPRATYMPYPFRIIMNEEQEQMLIAYEYAGAVRNVFLGENPGEAPLDSWMGQSWGYWDGDSFVIEVEWQNGQTWLDRAGNFLPYGAKVVERYTPVTENHVRYEATITEPETFTEPFTISLMLYRQMEEDAQIMDFNCVAFVEELLHGQLRKNPLQKPVEPPETGGN
ncbi:MAG: hypothetical protein CMK06_08195 [Ponticaulis sp.]|nr:hypothetical protein [Ponticaulis sp.]|tara:strand:+ start:18041 stop:18928 length:888 start_codon:yes stop_codon:yes gene_type:complete